MTSGATPESALSASIERRKARSIQTQYKRKIKSLKSGLLMCTASYKSKTKSA